MKQQQSPPAARPAPRPVTVMVVDDEEPIRVTVAAVLDAAGYATITAAGGEECLRRAAPEQPDLILLDVNMPGMDGFAVAARLTAEEKTRNIPIVMVSGNFANAERLKALRMGAVDFLAKPAPAEELIAKVRALARLKAYHDEARSQREALLAEVSGKSDQLRDALSAFARFVPREFLTCISRSSIVDVELGDNAQSEMAIVFADIRDFTALSETMSAKETFSFLNSYLGRMNPFIWENGGYIDKYIGDAIMALFPSGPGGALDGALAMLTHIPVYNAQRARFGYAPIRIGIGVHTGSVIMGVIGHERFMQGTAISDAVNLASRLEGLTKAYGVSLVVSSDVLFGLRDPNRYSYRFLDRVPVRGKKEAVPVYEVFDADPPAVAAAKTASKERFERGVYEYHAWRYDDALKLFEEIGTDTAPDTPAEIYRARCRKALAGESTHLAEGA